MNKSSTIIVDSKAGNLLYLPLDKLLGNQYVPQSENLKAIKNGTNVSNEEDNLILSGRDLTRPTYSQGRD